MARVKLTAGRIRSFSCKPEKQQDFLWDADAPGLAIRATATGSKAFVFQGKLNGKDVRVTIGDVRAWEIETGDHGRPGAREEARRLQTLLDKGIDPRQHKAERIAISEAKRDDERRQKLTLAEAWAPYITAARGTKGPWSARHLADNRNVASPGGQPKKKGKGLTQPGPLAALMPLTFEELTDTTIDAWMRDEVAKRPTQARLAFGALRAFLRWCATHSQYQGLANLESYKSTIARQSLPRKGAKSDCLQREQLGAWFDAVRKIRNPVIAAYLQTLLLTGARRGEIGSLTWDNLGFQWQSMTIRDKVDGERTIPLTPYVASLLSTLPRRNEWVFSSPPAASGRLQEPRIPHNRALAAADLPALSLHGLRRSFGTLAEWVECPAGIVAQIMGHKPSATAEKHYRVRPLDLLRMWHIRIEAWVLNEAGIEQPAVVSNSTLRLAK